MFLEHQKGDFEASYLSKTQEPNQLKQGASL